MNTCGIALALVAGLALSACVIAPTKTTETQPMPKSAIDTSWKLDKGFNLDEAKALIEFCTALDYGVDCRLIMQALRNQRTLPVGKKSIHFGKSSLPTACPKQLGPTGTPGSFIAR